MKTTCARHHITFDFVAKASMRRPARRCSRHHSNANSIHSIRHHVLTHSQLPAEPSLDRGLGYLGLSLCQRDAMTRVRRTSHAQGITCTRHHMHMPSHAAYTAHHITFTFRSRFYVAANVTMSAAQSFACSSQGFPQHCSAPAVVCVGSSQSGRHSLEGAIQLLVLLINRGTSTVATTQNLCTQCVLTSKGCAQSVCRPGRMVT
eukprot:3971-Heterococcus_DN1.PRE.4